MSLAVIADRFELRRTAGKGGMATVYEAMDRTSDCIVALKIVEGAFANARFEREASLLSRLQHPGIVRYVAHGRIAADRMYLAMEWLDGVPLDAHLAGGPMDLPDVLALGSHVARALTAAHTSGVVHRDVKPSNVILRGGRADDPIVVDFGIARAEDASRAMTATGAVVGTPAYMAPEQVRGDREIDARADTFSLGCLLFECLAGRPPFAGEHVVAVLAKILLEAAPRVASLRHDVPRALDDLVASMLEKSPDARPPTMARVSTLLDAIASEDVAPVVAEPARAIGVAEQRLATVLLARPKPSVGFGDEAFGETEQLLAGVTGEALAEAAPRSGVRMHRLADGALVGVLSAEHGGADVAARVVRCALELERGLEGAGVAIATGRALVAGAVPVGEAIDAAARLLTTTASRGGVWICASTRAMIDGRFELLPHGKEAKVRCESALQHRSRTLLGKATPCVGRDRELVLLEATLRECIDEPVARAMLVVAPAGIGKSRLQRELVERVREHCAVWLGLADPLMEGAAFAFIGDLLRRVLGVVEGEPLESRRRKILSHVSALGIADPERVGRRLGEISGTAFDAREDDALRAARRDPTLLAAQVSEAFVTFVLAELARRPHLVLLEDVHWADAASVRLLGAALARARDLPLMMLALARPTVDEVHPKLWEDQRCQRITLEPLLRKAAERLARAVLGDTADVAAIVRRADGNALFVEELARACAEGRAPDDLPPTVAAVTEARLGALPADARRALRAASIFGERFWTGGLARVIGAREATRLDESLALLEEREIVGPATSSRFEGEREYVFRHAVVRDVAYAMLTPEDRTLGHGLAAEWLEARIDDGALLAHHFEHGARPVDAAGCYVRAAEQALAAHDFDALFRSVARAEACGATPSVLGPARLAEAEAQLWIGDNVAAAQASRAALDALDRGSDKWFAALGIGAAALGKRGETAALLSLVGELEATGASDERSGRARAIARSRAAIQLAYSSEIARADALLAGCDEEPGASSDALVLAWLDDARVERGLAAGEPVHPSVARRARDLRFRLGDRRGAFGQWASETQLLGAIGAHEEALAVVDELARAGGESSHSIGAYIAMQRAFIPARLGDCELLLTTAKTLESAGRPRIANAAYVALARFSLLAGKGDDARRYAETALRTTGAQIGYQAIALAVLARLDVAAGNVEAALEASERALASTKGGTSIDAVALFYLARVEALEAAGRRDEARRVLQAGVDDLQWRSRHIGEYREGFYRAMENPTFLRLARERGVAAPSGT